MEASLDQAKARVRARFLGQPGVHAVGLRPGEGAIVVYVDDGLPGADDLRRRIEAVAAPHPVIVVAEPRAALS